jgi:hypothetical protein
MVAAKVRGIILKEVRIEAKMTQLQAMKSLVNDLPKYTMEKATTNNVEKMVYVTTKSSMGGDKVTCNQGARGGGQGQQ